MQPRKTPSDTEKFSCNARVSRVLKHCTLRRDPALCGYCKLRTYR
jgi:hypothetical protein